MVPERHRGKGRKETESWVRQAWYTRTSSMWEGSDTGEVEVRGERADREDPDPVSLPLRRLFLGV